MGNPFENLPTKEELERLDSKLDTLIRMMANNNDANQDADDRLLNRTGIKEMLGKSDTWFETHLDELPVFRSKTGRWHAWESELKQYIQNEF